MRIFLIIFLFPAILFSADEFQFTGESQVKEILFKNYLNCHMEEQNYKGAEAIYINSVDGDKVSGYSMFCWKKTGYKGVLKGNKYKWSTTDTSAPCYSRTGTLNFFKDGRGNIMAKGKYKVEAGASAVSGTLECFVNSFTNNSDK